MGTEPILHDGARRPTSPIYAGLKYIVVAYIISLAFWLQLAGAGHGVSMPPRRVWCVERVGAGGWRV